MTDQLKRPRRMVTVSAATVMLQALTMLLSLSIAGLFGIMAMTLIGKAETQRDIIAAENAELRADARLRAEDDRLEAINDRCQAAVQANNGLLTLDMLEAMSGYIEAAARGLSTDPPLDRLTAVRQRIVEDRAKRLEQLEQCSG